MTQVSDLAAVITAVTSSLRRHQIAYFITGSLASSVHGEFRATNAVDIVATIEPRQLPALMAELDGPFIADLEQAKPSLAAGTHFNLIHRETYLKVDVYPCLTAFDREATRCAEDVRLPGVDEPLRVATPEDVLLPNCGGIAWVVRSPNDSGGTSRVWSL